MQVASTGLARSLTCGSRPPFVGSSPCLLPSLRGPRGESSRSPSRIPDSRFKSRRLDYQTSGWIAEEFAGHPVVVLRISLWRWPYVLATAQGHGNSEVADCDLRQSVLTLCRSTHRATLMPMARSLHVRLDDSSDMALAIVRDSGELSGSPSRSILHRRRGQAAYSRRWRSRGDAHRPRTDGRTRARFD
jgi:hypothetical protein